MQLVSPRSLSRGLSRACLLGAVAAMLTLAGCATRLHPAPVEYRGSAANPAEAGKPLPGAENAGKPGYYTVKPGDTLIRISLESGQNWRDLVKWNNLDNPNVIEVGQVLRVVPPGASATSAASATAVAADSTVVAAKPVASAKVEARPLEAKPLPPASGAAPSASAAPATATASAAAAKSDDDIIWAWPAAGSVQVGFDEARNKGISLGGKAGDPVLAAADGRVVYAGSGLRGYGNLIIIKHNATYLSAYAHNQTLLVKEDQVVRRGQKIAEMGSTETDHVELHFEIRRLGHPVDPVKLLPPR